MIKLTYKHIDDRDFAQALVKLCNYGFKDQRFTYNLTKILRRYHAESQLANEKYLKVLKNYAELDEKGDFVNENGVPNSFKIPEDKKDAWKSAREEFQKTEFEIDCNKLRLEQLSEISLTAMDLLALEPCLSVIESVPAIEEAIAGETLESVAN